MSNSEFSDEFDVLYNNIMSNQAPGLDEYEKSVFLTKAQNEIVKNYFNPRGNKYQEGFDGSLKRQVDFSSLMSQGTSNLEAVSNKTFFYGIKGVYKITYPKDIFVIVNEVVDVLHTTTGEDGSTDTEKRRLQVIPVRFDEYIKYSSKPYKQPLKNQAWRIITAPDSWNLIIGHNNSAPINQGYKYYIRYIKKPTPIILENISPLSIEGIDKKTQCILDSEIHPEILQRAVELAKAAYIGDLNSTLELGKRSE